MNYQRHFNCFLCIIVCCAVSCGKTGKKTQRAEPEDPKIYVPEKDAKSLRPSLGKFESTCLNGLVHSEVWTDTKIVRTYRTYLDEDKSCKTPATTQTSEFTYRFENVLAAGVVNDWYIDLTATSHRLIFWSTASLIQWKMTGYLRRQDGWEVGKEQEIESNTVQVYRILPLGQTIYQFLRSHTIVNQQEMILYGDYSSEHDGLTPDKRPIALQGFMATLHKISE